METRQKHKAICSDCGAECEVPFEPTPGKKVRCQDCFRKNRPQRSFGNRRFDNRRFDNRKFDRGPREMHKATCAECGKECEVPFKPTEGRDVFCKDCYADRKEDRFKESDESKEDNSEEHKDSESEDNEEF